MGSRLFLLVRINDKNRRQQKQEKQTAAVVVLKYDMKAIKKQQCTTGAAPRWATARLGSAHARNTKNVWYYSEYRWKNDAENATVLPRVTLQKKVLE